MEAEAEENNEEAKNVWEADPNSDIDTWEIPPEGTVGDAREIKATLTNFKRQNHKYRYYFLD